MSGHFPLPCGLNTPESLTYSIVTDRRAIEALTPRITDLMKETGQAEDVTLAPEYFFNKNEPSSALTLVLLGQGEQIVAVLYGIERRLFSVKMGLVECGNHHGEGGVIAAKQFRSTAVALGALKLLERPGIHTVRASLKIKQNDETAAMRPVIDETRLKCRVFLQSVQTTLILENTFGKFLNRLGSHTRRNLRVYRRRVEQKGWKYVARVDPNAVPAAIADLERQQGRHRSNARHLRCCQAALQALPGSLFAGLCTATGEWVSLTGGWLRNDYFFMLIQLNDARYLRDSVSTVMRSCLIEDLIGSGVRTIHFVGGSSELLGRWCVPELCAHYLFEKKNTVNLLQSLIGGVLLKESLINRIHQACD
jgi:hypothetical protein